MEPTPAPPGWYQDQTGQTRWWDGTGWADQPPPAATGAPIRPNQDDVSLLVPIGVPAITLIADWTALFSLFLCFVPLGFVSLGLAYMSLKTQKERGIQRKRYRFAFAASILSSILFIVFLIVWFGQ
jgi:hypothetical protein